jgi:hypothetical protein
MKCALCKSDLGIKGRNPGGCLCGECSDEISGYDPDDWKMLPNNVVMHRFLECSFRIEREGEVLVAKKVFSPDEIFIEDVDHAQEEAVRAFLDLGGVSPRKPVWAAQVCRPRQDYRM